MLTLGISRSAGLGRTRLFHPWAHEPEGGWSGSDVSVSHVVRPRQGSGFEGLGWVPLGPKRARQGPAWSHMGLYISLTPIRDSRVIRPGSSSPLGSSEAIALILIWLRLGGETLLLANASEQTKPVSKAVLYPPLTWPRNHCLRNSRLSGYFGMPGWAGLSQTGV